MHGRVYKSGTKKIERCFANLALVIRSIEMEGEGEGRAGEEKGKRRAPFLDLYVMSCCVKLLYLRGLIANKETHACARARACGPKITLPQITMKLISITEVQRDVLRSARLSRIRYYPWRGSIWDEITSDWHTNWEYIFCHI